MIPLATFGNIMGFDGIIIFGVLLLLFGAKKLPELAKGLGSAVREFSKAKDEIHSEMTRAAMPQQPQIVAPKYTEPHVTTQVDEHGHTDYHHTDAHGYVVPPDPVPVVTVPSPVAQVQPETLAAEPIKSMRTEEQEKHPSHLV